MFQGQWAVYNALFCFGRVRDIDDLVTIVTDPSFPNCAYKGERDRLMS